MTREVRAPLAGKVLSLRAEVGSPVEEDGEVLVIEALKMETIIYAPCEGTLKEFKVNEGDQVEEDDLLALIE